MSYITASKLYDYLQCPHRVWRDIYGPEEEKIKETNPFVELLWEKGIKHEEKIVSKLGDFLNLKDGPILGFKWRDETPSGALSIQWFNEYLKTKEESILKRILEYNEDDCKATMILKDSLERL